MKKTLHFETLIDALKETVWDIMLQSPTYEVWTSEFCEGSHFEGSWDEGAELRFLDPNGNGMISVIKENIPYEFISIKHIGIINDGMADSDSEQARQWAPAYENYRFSDEGGITALHVDMEVTPDFEQMMVDTWPRALEKLKTLCEAGART